ncbi:MAG: type II secretion system protein J [Aliiglaciecola sp.]
MLNTHLCQRRVIKGFSIVELLIAMTLGLSVMAGLTAFTGRLISFNAKTMTLLRLQEELQTIAIFLSREISRSGAIAQAEIQAKNGIKSKGKQWNGFTFSHFPNESPNSCMLFAYDRDWDGQLSRTPNNEHYGFRLKNKAIEFRVAGANCDENGWQDLSDPNIVEVTRLQFNPIAKTRALVQVQLAGQLKQDPNHKLNMDFVVRVKNSE